MLLKQDNLPPNQWALGRITEVYPGNDNVVRVASVRTSKGVYNCVRFQYQKLIFNCYKDYLLFSLSYDSVLF